MPEIIVAIYLFALGTIVASFMCALVYRMESMESWRDILVKPSHCEGCGKPLRWYELIPVFSWVAMRGKCSKCHKKISVAYPIFELLVGVNFALFYLTHQPLQLYIASVMVAFVAIYDVLYMQVPQRVFVVFGIAAVLIFGVTHLTVSVSFVPLIEGLGLAGFIFLLNRLKESFGMADILTFLILALFLGDWQLLKTAYAAVVIGAIVSVALIVAHKKTPKSYIPFLPFIYAGFVLIVGLSI